MKISLIAGPNTNLFMTWDNDKNIYPVVVADFGNIPQHIALANELMALYNNHQAEKASLPDNVVAMPQKEVKSGPVNTKQDP